MFTLADKVRFGVVGVGVPRKDPSWKAQMHYFVPSIAWARYFPQIDKNPRAELTAICDIAEDRLEEVKDAYKVRETYTDYDEMLKSDIDAVVVTTPNKFHFPMAMSAMKAGKHLIVEKPLAINLKEASTVVQESKKKKVKLMPAPWVFDDSFYKIREMIDKGLLGKICLLKAKIGHMGPGHGQWFYKAGFGAGVTFDLAIYPATTFTGLVGPAKRVFGMTGTAIEKRVITEKEIPVEVEDNEIIGLDFGNGTFGEISANYCTQVGYGPSLEVFGSKGAVFVENGLLKFLTQSSGVRGIMTSARPMVAQFPYEPIIERFIDFIKKDVDVNYLGDQQVHVIEILEKSLESSAKGKKLELTTTFENKVFS